MANTARNYPMSIEETEIWLRAIEDDNIEIIDKSLHSKDANVDSCDERGNTALQIAAANGNELCVRKLLMNGAALDRSNVFGWTPLLHAARNGHITIARTLIQNGCDISCELWNGLNALAIAARGGHLSIVRLLVDAGLDVNPSLSTAGNYCEITPLMFASMHRHYAVAKYLIDRGSDVNFQTPSCGLNALMFAAIAGHTNLCKLLLEHAGADANLTNINGLTALELAILKHRKDAKLYLATRTTAKLKMSRETKPNIIDAARSGDINRVNDLLLKDPSLVDAASSTDGATPLIAAAIVGHLDVCHLLVTQYRASLNAQDTVNGWTALMQATFHGKKDVALFLLNAGCDVHVKAQNGFTAFDIASIMGDIDTVLYRALADRVAHSDSNAKAGTLPHSASLPTATLPSDFSSLTLDRIQTKSNIKGAWSMTAINKESSKSGGRFRGWWSRVSSRFKNFRSKPPNKLRPLAESRYKSQSTYSVDEMSSGDLFSSKEINSEISRPNVTGLIEAQSSLISPRPAGRKLDLTSATIRPVEPPYLPPPTFELTSPDKLRKRSSLAARRDSGTENKMYHLSPMRAGSTQSPKVPALNLQKILSNSTYGLAAIRSPTSVLSPSPTPTGSRFQFSFNSSLSTAGSTSSVSSSSHAVRSTYTASSGSGDSGKPSSSASSSTLTADSSSRIGVVSPNLPVVWENSAGLEKNNNNRYATPARQLNSKSVSPTNTPSSRSTLISEASTPSTLTSHSYRPNVTKGLHSKSRDFSSSPSPENSKHSSRHSPRTTARHSTQTTKHSTHSPLSKSESSKTKHNTGDSFGDISEIGVSSPLASIDETRESRGTGVDSNARAPDTTSDAELSGLLSKLSLERYQTVFEHEDVDLETFLTLTDSDLKEIGVTHSESRLKILTAIAKLNSESVAA